MPFIGMLLAGIAVSQVSPAMSTLDKPLPDGFKRALAVRPMAATETLNLSISLNYRDPLGVQRFVNEVSNPKGANYHKFITPEEVGRRFGPTEQTLAQVKDFLEANGIHPQLVGKNRLTLLADTTVSKAEKAFKTKINLFQANSEFPGIKGKLFSYTSSPSIPTALKPYIVDIGGLESFSHAKPRGYVTPGQLQTIYNVAPMINSGVQGQGRTVAISNWDGYKLANVPHEYSQFGLPAPSGGVGSNITVKTIDGGSGAGTEQGEADLDIQSILAVAPQCNLVIYDGAGGDLLNVLTHEANDNIADIITESYGWRIDTNTKIAAHNLHLSMSAQGITYMAASGDSGTTLSYTYPNVEPEVLMVGGTTLHIDILGQRASETGWSGSGGGWAPTADTFNTLPSYQQGTGVPTNIPYRLIPDVALNADPATGYVVYLNGNFYVIGGTSGASPTFAGALATASQQLIANGGLSASGSGNYRFGRIQDLIYSFNGNPNIFFDVTSGANGSLPNGAASSAAPGWDFVTGWGAMDFSAFVTQLSGSGLVQFNLNPTSVLGGNTVTGTVTTSGVALSGGTVITISGGDSNISYPTTVIIPSGSRSATFSITTSAVAASVSEALSATDGTNVKNATLVVNPPPISSFTFSPSSAVGGSTLTATVNLAQAAAQPNGDVVTISGGDAAVSYPTTVTVPAGQTSVSFSVTSNLVAANTNESLTATLGSSTKTTTLTLTGMAVSALAIAPTSVNGGTSVVGTVTLSNAAPVGGEVVTLSGGDSSVSYPATVTVAAAAKTATFTVTTSANAVGVTTETITATLGTSSKSTPFTLNGVILSTFTLAPTSIFGGQNSTGTLTLNRVAGSAGAVISLSGGDPSVSYPSTVTVAANSNKATFVVGSSVVQTNVNESFKATLGSSNITSVLTVKPAGVVSALTFSPTSVAGGKTSVGTVKLTGPAGPSGVTVTISGGDSNVSYPSTVTVAASASSVNFNVTTVQTSSDTPELLTATIGPSTASGTLTVLATTVSNLTLSPTSVFGGQNSMGTITLNGPAGSQGVSVALSGGDSSVSYPSAVTVPGGTTTATFTVSTSTVSVNTNETLSATLNGPAKTATIQVKPAGVVSGLSFNPTTIVGGRTSVGTVKLTGGAGPSGVTVTLSGGDANVSYPATVTIASGATTANFTVTSTQVSTNVAETLTATIGPSSASAALTVQATTVSAFALAPTSVFGSQNSIGTITLNGPAGSQGTVVALSGGDSSVSYPSSITVAAGATSATFTVATSVVAIVTNETLTASLNGSTKTASVSLKPAGVISSLTFNATSVVGGVNATGTVKLTGPAGPAGVTVTLSGGDSNVSYPSTITIASGATSGTFTVATTQVTSNTLESLKAAIGPSSANGSFTLVATTVSALTFNPTSVFGGQGSTGTIALNGPAGSAGVTVALSGGDSNIGYPSTVTIASGATSATFAVSTSTVSLNVNEPISANLNGVTKASTLLVKPAGVVSSLSFAPATVVGGVNAVGTIKLTGAAGPTGVTVTLSGGDSNISYPSTVSIAAGATSATFTASTLAVSASTSEPLVATIGPSSAGATLVVTPASLLAFTIAPAYVYGGNSVTGTVTLTGPAGPNGVTITISGGDAFIAYATALSIAAGSSTGSFTITASVVSANRAEVLTAKLGSATKSATATILK